jgi:hypothetical protein
MIIWINPSTVFLHAQEAPNKTDPDKISQPPFVKSAYYNKLLSDAMILQNMADSLAEIAYQYRQELMYMDNVSERNRLQFQLGVLEERIKSIRTEADSLFLSLSNISEWPSEETSLLILDTVIDGIKIYQYNLEELAGSEKQINNPNHSLKVQKENPESAAGSVNIFTISTRPAYSSDHPFEYDFQIPSGVFYRIQLAVYSQEAGWDQFGGIQPVTVEINNGGALIKYFAGKFSRYTDAESALDRIRSAGFGDAFIVSYYNGHRMSTEQIREFEKSVR